jgi:hypothetical protein
MAIQEAVTSVTLIAAADLRTHQFKWVTVNSSGLVALTGDDAAADGVLLNAPNAGEAATVQIGGITKVKCGGVVTRGGLVASGAAGVAKNADTNALTMGRALETGASGRVISILLKL